MNGEGPGREAGGGPRWEVRTLKGPPRGDLYELEVRTRYHVVDRRTGEVVLEFVGDYEATYATDGSGWTDAEVSGATEVRIAADERSALVRFADGREETWPLPE